MNYHEALAEHYHQIRTNPQYRMLEMIEDMRAEMMPTQWDIPKEPIPASKEEEPWSKKQWSIVNQLRGMVQFLYLKETERRASASKRKPKRLK